MAQNYTWPAGFATAVSPSTGPNGAPIPSESTLVGGKSPTSTLLPLNTDASGNVIVSPLTASSTVTANQGTAAAVAGAWPILLTNGTNTAAVSAADALKVDGSAVTQPISAASLPLPAGASTAALQTQISGQLPSTLGQKTMAASLSVAVASDQSTIPVSAASLPLPSGAATAANQTNGSQETQIVAGGNTASVTAASALKVDGSAVTQPVSAASLPLPSGASTSALQTTISGQLPASLGQKAMAASLSVAIASDQSAVVVNGSGVTKPISAVSLPLPTGAATAANQTNGNQETQIVQGGNTASVTAASALKVDGSAVTQPVSQKTPAAGTITQAAISVGTSAVRLTVSGSVPSSTRSVLVATPDAASTGKFYIGSSSVTSSGSTRGVQLQAGQIFTANSDAGDYWIISDTAAQTVEVMEQA